jgi:glutamine amidotransferase-like uncharacterized protein
MTRPLGLSASVLVAAIAAPSLLAASEWRVGVYVGPGADAADAERLAAAIPKIGLSVEQVGADDLEAGLEGLDVLVVGGGSGTRLAKGLAGGGAEALERWVRGGGGYVGLGAGAYLAAQGYNEATRGLELIDAKIVDHKNWKRGEGAVRLRGLGGRSLPTTWEIQNGPLFIPGRTHGLPPYEALAAFDSDIAAADEKKKGVMPGKHAVVRAPYGEGRVALFSVLPHHRGETVPPLVDAIGWAAGDGDAGSADVPQAPAGALKVAVLDDEGCIGSCVLGAMVALDALGDRFWTRRVDGDEVAAGVLEGYDVVLLPGGSATGQNGAIGPAGRAQVVEFVAKGGGYVGICAGGYLAASEPRRYGLGLVAARVADTKHWKRGEGMVKLSGEEALKEVTGRAEDAFTMLYANGPLLEPMEVEGLPTVTPLLVFRSDMHKSGPAGVMPGKLAALSAEYREGRVVLFSVHPELTKGHGDMLAQATLWVARRR